MTSPWFEAMAEAVRLAQSPDVPASSNPRVGCVLLDDDGQVIGRGHHRGTGTAHAEVIALADAGARARGATAVVTLEPCCHTGRTGPCTQALFDAGVRRVVYGVDDPGEQSGGGAQILRRAGVEVVAGVGEDIAREAMRAWLHVQRTGRPLVTLKSAVSLDGRVADGSGGPTAITGPEALAVSHEWRSRVDAIVVGTGTVLADDPSLTARTDGGELMARQPLRVVVGSREVPGTARIHRPDAETLVVPRTDLALLLSDLALRDVQHVLVEGGPTLAGAFLQAGLVDEVLWFVGPVILGAGPVALPSGSSSVQVSVRRVTVVGEDVIVEGTVEGASGVHGHR